MREETRQSFLERKAVLDAWLEENETTVESCRVEAVKKELSNIIAILNGAFDLSWDRHRIGQTR